MNASLWLVRDTFRQAFASGIFWLMLAVSLLAAGACLTVRVTDAVHGVPVLSSKQGADQVLEAPELAPARVELLSGALTLDVPHARAHPVRTLQLQLAGWVADAAGLVLALIWTAGFLPSFLAPRAASVLLAKPVPRGGLLAGKFAGVVLFVAFQTTAFVVLTWLALAVRTGVWDAQYLLCIPLLVGHFAVYYSFSVMLAVATRSTPACIFGTIVFWLICWRVNLARYAGAVLSMQGVSPTFGRTLDLGYWVLPKPLDFHFLLMQTLGAENLLSRVVDIAPLTEKGLWQPAAAVASSLLFGLVILLLSAHDFRTKDY
jgi:ABC-type transport system involved in multi-copper enzyme maturation permease subunit